MNKYSIFFFHSLFKSCSAIVQWTFKIVHCHSVNEQIFIIGFHTNFFFWTQMNMSERSTNSLFFVHLMFNFPDYKFIEQNRIISEEIKVDKFKLDYKSTILKIQWTKMNVQWTQLNVHWTNLNIQWTQLNIHWTNIRTVNEQIMERSMNK